MHTQSIVCATGFQCLEYLGVTTKWLCNHLGNALGSLVDEKDELNDFQMSFRWLWDDCRMTSEWFWNDFRWLRNDFVITSYDIEMTSGWLRITSTYTDRNFVVEFDTWAKKFLDLTFCQHSNASSEYSGQNNWLIFVCAISELG